ncbi:hypothetical protein BJX66DRAFT_121184 [Aspergillus keveii]|uniref:Uncharacterized protein n=1 Tax=Aspergillus keveii TaxID=714993 RepID=A0ABR4FJY2_9EURO
MHSYYSYSPSLARPSYFRRSYPQYPRYRGMGLERLTKVLLVGTLSYVVIKKIAGAGSNEHSARTGGTGDR